MLPIGETILSAPLSLTSDSDGVFTVTIPAGYDRVWIQVPTVDDRRLWSSDGQAWRDLGNQLDRIWQPAYELHGNVKLEAVEGGNYEPGLPGGTLRSDTVKVLDNEPAIVTLSRSADTPEYSYGSRNPDIREGDDYVFWINRYRDETGQALDVRVQLSVLDDKCLSPLGGTSGGKNLTFREANPFAAASLEVMTFTIPAGASHQEARVPTIQDIVVECYPSVVARVLTPANAEELKAAHPRGTTARKASRNGTTTASSPATTCSSTSAGHPPPSSHRVPESRRTSSTTTRSPS